MTVSDTIHLYIVCYIQCLIWQYDNLGSDGRDNIKEDTFVESIQHVTIIDKCRYRYVAVRRMHDDLTAQCLLCLVSQIRFACHRPCKSLTSVHCWKSCRAATATPTVPAICAAGPTVPPIVPSIGQSESTPWDVQWIMFGGYKSWYMRRMEIATCESSCKWGCIWLYLNYPAVIGKGIF